MIDYITYIFFLELPEEKEDEVREWVKIQNEKTQKINPYWKMYTCRFDGFIAIDTNYHYNRMRLPLYIYQLYQKFHDQCNMRVEIWSDLDGGNTAEDYYHLDDTIEAQEDWAEFLEKYSDEDTINRIFDELWEKRNENEEKIAFVNALKAVDELKENEYTNEHINEYTNEHINNIPDLPF